MSAPGLDTATEYYDAQIGARTLNARHNLVVLWSCGTANEDQTGEVIGSIAQLVRNRGFESGSSYWVLGGDGDRTVTNEDRLFGSYSLLLGFKTAALGKDKFAYAYQLISLPAGVQAWVTFWYHLYTYDRTDYDRFEVYIAPVGGNPTRMFYKGGTARGLSLDGYARPDGSGRCFIGWQYYSMPLSNATGYGTYTYAEFVKKFYHYLLVERKSVKDALDSVSYECIGVRYFYQTRIYQGWWQYFPEQNVTLYCKVRVWGDGGMTLP